jgi:hypothetical protein
LTTLPEVEVGSRRDKMASKPRFRGFVVTNGSFATPRRQGEALTVPVDARMDKLAHVALRAA